MLYHTEYQIQIDRMDLLFLFLKKRKDIRLYGLPGSQKGMKQDALSVVISHFPDVSVFCIY